VLVVSYGSGAGSDGFILRATSALPARRGAAPTVSEQLGGRLRYLSYAEYAKHRGKILLND